MKAAVLHQLGEAPKYEDFQEPVSQNEHQLLMTVKAASVKNIDKGRASGGHYASYKNLAEVVRKTAGDRAQTPDRHAGEDEVASRNAVCQIAKPIAEPLGVPPLR